jgi:hypothetical protein
MAQQANKAQGLQFSEFRNLIQTSGSTPWTGDRLVARTVLPTQDNTNMEQNADIHVCPERDSNP